MVLWAVVSDEIDRVVKLFPTRWEAERLLAKALWDGPSWRGILRVEKIELRGERRTKSGMASLAANAG